MSVCPLDPDSSDFGDVCALYAPFLHQLTMQSSLFERGCPVLVVVCVARKLRPCPSYSRRRDRINLGLWRSLYKGAGYKGGWGVQSFGLFDGLRGTCRRSAGSARPIALFPNGLERGQACTVLHFVHDLLWCAHTKVSDKGTSALWSRQTVQHPLTDTSFTCVARIPVPTVGIPGKVEQHCMTFWNGIRWAKAPVDRWTHSLPSPLPLCSICLIQKEKQSKIFLFLSRTPKRSIWICEVFERSCGTAHEI